MRNPSRNTIKMLNRLYPYLFEGCDALTAARYAVECLRRDQGKRAFKKYLESNLKPGHWKLLRIE